SLAPCDFFFQAFLLFFQAFDFFFAVHKIFKRQINYRVGYHHGYRVLADAVFRSLYMDSIGERQIHERVLHFSYLSQAAASFPTITRPVFLFMGTFISVRIFLTPRTASWNPATAFSA